MRARLLLALGLAGAMFAAGGSAEAGLVLLPGAGDLYSLDIYDGWQLLPGPVVAGDVVLLDQLDGPSTSTDPSNWSGVVRFANYPAESGQGLLGTAQLFSDGFGSDFDLQTNRVFIAEGDGGPETGGDYLTVYEAGPSTYLIHTHGTPGAASEPEAGHTPEPATLGLLAIGTLGLVASQWRRRLRRL